VGSDGTMHISGSMKVGKGVQGILRILLSSLQGSNIHNADRRDL
jgi:hypothetical protein